MGGEESGGIGFQRHLPERDGLLNALLLANVMAEEARRWASWSPTYRPNTASTSMAASTCTSRRDQERSIARARALKTGDPVFAECRCCARKSRRGEVLSRQPGGEDQADAAETWLLLRASGTEPLLRIYTEICSKESVAKLLESARRFAMEGETLLVCKRRGTGIILSPGLRSGADLPRLANMHQEPDGRIPDQRTRPSHATIRYHWTANLPGCSSRQTWLPMVVLS